MAVYEHDSPELVTVAIESVLHQSHQNLEFTIIADGPLPCALSECIQFYAGLDQRISRYALPAHAGLAAALNAGIRLSRGEYLIRMDADDVSREDRIAKLLQFLAEHPDVDIAGSYISEFYTGEHPTSGRIVAYPCDHRLMRQQFLRRNPVAHPSVIFRRRFFDAAGLYPTLSVRNEDTLLWLSGFVSGCTFANVCEPLVFVRFDPQTAFRRMGLRKAFWDFNDRLRVIAKLNGSVWDVLFAGGLFVAQLTPGPVYRRIRSLGVHGSPAGRAFGTRYIFKRALDLCVAGIALPLLLPMFLLIAIVIKLDSPGPVIYRGRRTGQWGRAFDILKFRTMCANAEALGGSTSSERDPRITRVGRWLRRWKLDELPQLLNILAGQMSLVGPRPDVEKYSRMLHGRQISLLSLKPGLTDWASIWGCREGRELARYADPEWAYEHVIWPTKIALQMKYLTAATLWTDIKILAFTLVCIISSDWLPCELETYLREGALTLADPPENPGTAMGEDRSGGGRSAAMVHKNCQQM
jgi:lipopolysaccharide/colanic/teichoic acid biosynthesis glycosyltransferase/glycosyltransferase involved in cell wall biosynthesis